MLSDVRGAIIKCEFGTNYSLHPRTCHANKCTMSQIHALRQLYVEFKMERGLINTRKQTAESANVNIIYLRRTIGTRLIGRYAL